MLTSISEKRYEIAQQAERDSHIVKKDLDILDRRLASSQKVVTPYIQKVEGRINILESTVLDIGCGPTCLGRFFTGGKKYYLDPLMDFYKEYYPGKLPTDGELVTGGAETLDFANNTFDVVLSNNMLDHTFKPTAIVAEIARTLKKDGYLILGIYTHSPIIKFFRTIAEASWIFKERPHPYSYTIKDVKKIFKNGFELETIDIIKGEEKLFNFRRRYYYLVLRKP